MLNELEQLGAIDRFGVVIVTAILTRSGHRAFRNFQEVIDCRLLRIQRQCRAESQEI